MKSETKEGKILHVSGHLSKLSGARVYLSSECPHCDTVNDSTLVEPVVVPYTVQCKTCEKEYLLK